MGTLTLLPAHPLLCRTVYFLFCSLVMCQTASPLVPALVWSASCRFKPLVGILGADWRAAGRGGLDWRLWGWLPAVAESGPGPLDAAMLARWLAGAQGSAAERKWQAQPQDQQAYTVE